MPAVAEQYFRYHFRDLYGTEVLKLPFSTLKCHKIEKGGIYPIKVTYSAFRCHFSPFCATKIVKMPSVKKFTIVPRHYCLVFIGS
jgi:hypothetical protein